MPVFTLAVGLVDGFNPCAMWVLLFLLSILVNLRDRRRIIAIAGTFVIVSGLAYFAFMAAWLNVFLLIGYLRPIQVVLALIAILIGAVHVKDFFAFKQGFSLSIPESAKPGIYEKIRKIVAAEHLTAAVAGAIVLDFGAMTYAGMVRGILSIWVWNRRLAGGVCTDHDIFCNWRHFTFSRSIAPATE